MNLKAKIQAAANKAASISNDDKKGKYTKTVGPNTNDKVPMSPVARQKFDAAKQQYMASTMKKKEAPMSSMPTLRPTSVSNPNRPVARPYGEMTASKGKKRG
jgi:hypothetical protein